MSSPVSVSPAETGLRFYVTSTNVLKEDNMEHIFDAILILIAMPLGWVAGRIIEESIRTRKRHAQQRLNALVEAEIIRRQGDWV